MNYASIILNMNRLQPNEMMRGLSNGPQEKLVSLNNKMHVTSLTRLKDGGIVLSKLQLFANYNCLCHISITYLINIHYDEGYSDQKKSHKS